MRGATEHFYRLPGLVAEAEANGKPAEHGLGDRLAPEVQPLRKRTTGVEPATSSLGSLRSTN